MVSYEDNWEFTVKVPDEYIADGFDVEDLERLMHRRFEPVNAESDVKSEDEAQRDFVDFQEVEPLLLDVVALLKIMHKVDVAVESGVGVKLNFTQTRVLHRALMDATPLNGLEKQLQGMYSHLTGKYFDHEKYGQP